MNIGLVMLLEGISVYDEVSAHRVPKSVILAFVTEQD